MWACKVIALFIKHNDLRLSSNRQLELSLLHPDVLVERLIRVARVKKMNQAAIKIQRASRSAFELLRKRRAEEAKFEAASII